MSEQKQEKWPSFFDLLDRDMPLKRWWTALGDKHSLNEAVQEMRRFSRDAPWTAERETAVIAGINRVAFMFRYCQWLDWMAPPSSRTEVREGLVKIAKAIERLQKLAWEYRASVNMADKYYPGDRWAFHLMMFGGLQQFEDVFATALDNGKFKRKGRAESTVSAQVLLLLDTRKLMEQFAGHRPGFSRETDASPGPLIRTVKAIQRYATGEPGGFPDRFIAQAEQLSKKNADALKLFLER